MFTEEAPSFDGRYYRIHEARNVPAPVQPGGPPILIGGGGEKRTLRLVARYADMMNIFGDAATVAHKVDVLRGHCAALGREPFRDHRQPAQHACPHRHCGRRPCRPAISCARSPARSRRTSDIGTPDEPVARVEELGGRGSAVLHLQHADGDAGHGTTGSVSCSINAFRRLTALDLNTPGPLKGPGSVHVRCDRQLEVF